MKSLKDQTGYNRASASIFAQPDDTIHQSNTSLASQNTPVNEGGWYRFPEGECPICQERDDCRQSLQTGFIFCRSNKTSDRSFGMVSVDKYGFHIWSDGTAGNQKSKTGTSAYIQNILFHLRPLLFVKEWEEKPSSERLPFLNGVLDIPTMELLPHSPSHYLTWTLPRNYEPDASDWGLIKAWLDESLKGKQDDIWKVLCFFAAIIRGRTDIQRFLECRGAGGSGKSTLANLATKLVGDRNMIPMSWRSITNDYKMADFKGKRLAVFADAGVANADQMEVFRAMTGEDKLSGRPIRESWIEFYSSALCIVTANKPIFSGQGHSWYGRRAVVLKFDNYVEKPRNLMKEFEPQIPAFLNYLLTISDEDITLTFEKKRGVSLHAWESMVESDSVAAWINDCIKREPGYMSTIGAKPGELDAIKSGALASNFETLTLYAHYVWYCRENGLMARSKNTFSSAVLDQCNQVLGWREVQKTTNKANSRVMVGIRLRSPEDLRLSDSLTQAASLETSLTS